MRLYGIGCKDYICISNVLSKDAFFTRDPPDFTSELSMDSLVVPSKVPEGIGLPGSHFGSAAFTASTNACLFQRILSALAVDGHSRYLLKSVAEISYHKHLHDLLCVS